MTMHALKTVVLPRDLEQQPSAKDTMLMYCQTPSHAQLQGKACAVCLETFSDSSFDTAQCGTVHFCPKVSAIRGCQHCFHHACLQRWLGERQRCPVCSLPCGTIYGSGPFVGEMSCSVESYILPGHADSCGTLVLSFLFPQGVDDNGEAYAERRVESFLPDSAVGWKILALFQIAFKRRLLFSLGTSLSTGRRWPTFNIHMKTSRSGGIARHGYPDAGFIERVQTELAENGVRLAAPGSDHEHILPLPREAKMPAPPASIQPAPLIVEMSADGYTGEPEKPDLAIAELGPMPNRAVVCLSGNKCLICNAAVPDNQIQAHMFQHTFHKDARVSIADSISTAGVKKQSGPLSSSALSDSPLADCVECLASRLVPELICEANLSHVASHIGSKTCAECIIPLSLHHSAVEHGEQKVTCVSAADCSTSAGSGYQSGSPSVWELIPCEHCDAQVSFEMYMDHLASHSCDQNCVKCSKPRSTAELTPEHMDLCSCCLQMLNSEIQSPAKMTPESLAMQMVEIVRQCFVLSGDMCNFDIAVGFVREMISLYHAGYPEIEVVYHWTRQENISLIADNNLRISGETNSDGSRVETANGSRYGKGIYAATDLEYGRRYGRGATGALLCLALPGKVRHGRWKITDYHMENLDSPGTYPDSISDGPVRVYRSSAQLLPLFITDEEDNEALREKAFSVSELVKDSAHLFDEPAAKAQTRAAALKKFQSLGGA